MKKPITKTATIVIITIIFLFVCAFVSIIIFRSVIIYIKNYDKHSIQLNGTVLDYPNYKDIQIHNREIFKILDEYNHNSNDPNYYQMPNFSNSSVHEYNDKLILVLVSQGGSGGITNLYFLVDNEVYKTYSLFWGKWNAISIHSERVGDTVVFEIKGITYPDRKKIDEIIDF